MPEKSGFFDAHKVGGTWDRTYISEDFARYFSAFVGNGVFAHKSDELQVRQSSPQGMSVIAASGMSWLDGYFYYNDSELQLSLDNADGSLDRIDTVVCRWSAVDRLIRTVVKKGVAAVSPQAPTPQWNSDIKELQLASIRIPAGTTSITQSLITDTRPNTTVCGWVTALIDQVDTSTLFLQWQDAYNQELANTQNYIAQQKALWDAFFDSVSGDIGLIDGSVTTSKLANQAVTADKLAASSVTEGKLAPDAVTTDKLADQAVTADKLASNAITTSKLANQAVTANKLASDAVKLLFTNISVPASAWASGGTIGGAMRPIYADVPLSNVTSNMYVSVVFKQDDIEAYNFAATCYVSDGFIEIYAEKAPTVAITIPTIICLRA